MNKKSLGKILVATGLLLALLVLGRAYLYAPNNEVDSDIQVTHSSIQIPSKLSIPKIDVEAEIQHVGITENGNMAAPNNFSDVSWYKHGTVPGQRGSAVIAGHEDNAIATPAVFYNLHKMEIGDEIYVTTKDGEKLSFKVVDKKIHPYNLSGTELEKIFDSKDKARLNLITCAGDWLPEAKTNDKRLVIYTELVKS